MKSFTFRLPVKKYIQKYLTTLHGETIPAVMDSDFGFVVLMTLSSRLEAQVCRGYNDQFFWDNPYKGTVTFTVPYHYFYLTKKELTKQTCIMLNRYFETKFEEDLARFIDNFTVRGGKYKAAIFAFASVYNIELDVDISFEGLKKMEYRWRKKNQEKFLCRLSPEINLYSKAS